MAEKTSKEQPKISADMAAGTVSAEELSPDEDRRILRRIDLWCVAQRGGNADG